MIDDIDLLAEKVITEALGEIRSKGLNGQIVTIALYFDHESPALSICADTLENSEKHTASSLKWSYEHLVTSLESGDLENAGLFSASVGRSLSLGDFTLVNLARLELDSDKYSDPGNDFFLSLANGLYRNRAICFEVCDKNQQIQFSCSTAEDEVGLFWSPTLEES